jgi:hypothetical protein
VPPLVFPGVFGGSSGVWAAHVVIVNSSLRMVRKMIRIVRGHAPAILSPTVGSSVLISVCPVIGGPTGRIEFVGAHVALAAAALAAVLRDRGGWPPAVHPGLSFSSRAHLASFGEMTFRVHVPQYFLWVHTLPGWSAQGVHQGFFLNWVSY